MTAWLRPSGYNGLAWAAVDLRCPPPGRKQDWLFRPSIDAPGQTPSNDVLTEVHAIATGLREAMSHEAITEHLRVQGLGDLASALTPVHDQEQVSRWHTLARAGERRSSHPFLFQDAGRRLALQFTLNAEKLDRGQLRQLVAATLQHLSAAMDRVEGTPG